MILPKEEMRSLAALVLDEAPEYGEPAETLACHVLALADELEKRENEAAFHHRERVHGHV